MCENMFIIKLDLRDNTANNELNSLSLIFNLLKTSS